jgi:hypothetical protein
MTDEAEQSQAGLRRDGEFVADSPFDFYRALNQSWAE